MAHKDTDSLFNATKSKKYFRDWADRLDRRTHLIQGGEFLGYDNTEFIRKQANYDLYNNIINTADFVHVFSGTGLTEENIPARISNKDITSPKIKAVMGLDLERPFEFRVAAVNREATTEAEETEAELMKEFVYQEVMGPIIEEVMANAEQSEEGMAEAQAQIEQMTPEKIHRYMTRKHQDPAEVHAQQLLEFLGEKCRVVDKFRSGLKHACLSAYEVYHIYEKNGHPEIGVVNPLFFRFDMSPDIDTIEDGEWASAEYRMTPSEIFERWGRELTTTQKKKIQERYNLGDGYALNDEDWWNYSDDRDGVRVVHCVWKGSRKIGYLTYKDQHGQEQEMMVPHDYKLDKSRGDIKVEWDYIPEVHEAWKILDDIYVQCRVLPYQHKDPDNVWDVKLPYYGAVYDYENSTPTSFMDRMREYQYLNNIVWYRIEMLMAQDKGKKLMLNMNAIPRKQGFDLEKFEYYLEVQNVGYLDPNQEGNKFNLGNVPELVKEVDLSGGGNIEKYMNISEYLDKKAGEAIGIPKELEGQIHHRSAVSNVQQTMYVASTILEEFYQKRSRVKRNVLQGLLELAKEVYHDSDVRALTYVTDDMTKKFMSLDVGLLDSATFGVFVIDSQEAGETKETIRELAHAAMQSGVISMSSVVKVLRARGIQEAEEELELAEMEAMRREEAKEQAAAENEQRVEEMRMQTEQMRHENRMKEIELTEKWRHKTAIMRQALLAMGFDDEKDRDNNNVPDVLQALKMMLEDRSLEAIDSGSISEGANEPLVTE